MGGSSPSAPVTYMPAPTAPTLYTSKIPEADYGRIADYLARIKEDTRMKQNQRYREVGTPAEIGARQKGIQMQESASYLASLPKGAQYDAARQAAGQRVSDATTAYTKGVETADKLDYYRPTPEKYETPSWAVPTEAEKATQSADEAAAIAFAKKKAEEVAAGKLPEKSDEAENPEEQKPAVADSAARYMKA